MTAIDRDLSRRTFVLTLMVIGMLAMGLRAVYQPADPPTHASVGITWHDEGVWTHNARNRALFGAWRLDEWNPMFVSPVFTGLEYLSFSVLGVGWQQARLVSELAGVLSVFLIGMGVALVANRLSGSIAAALLATNYVYVMYDRVALLEATMIALLVASWWCYARAQMRPLWGGVSGFVAVLAMLSKASAAFFLVALAVDALLTLVLARSVSGGTDGSRRASADSRRHAAWWTIAGLGVAGATALALFVVPNWHEYRWYNLEIYGARRSALGFRQVLDRASWFPIIHDFFTRMWLVTLMGGVAAVGMLVKWRTVHPAERLLALWIGLGSAELILHDLGNERRFVFLIPALVALAAIVLGRDRRLVASEFVDIPRRRALAAAPLLLSLLYVFYGSIIRLAFLYEIGPGVRWSAVVAASAALLLYVTWPRIPRWLSAERWTVGWSIALTLVVASGDLGQFVQWASGRTYNNHEASRAIADWLPDGTQVQGKLANGLSLDNRIRPLYIGPGFGNYGDRRSRDDVRYVLTYVTPRIGYEGIVIADVLAAYPGWRIVRTFDVRETPAGNDKAALIDKFGDRTAGPTNTNGTGRAQD